MDGLAILGYLFLGGSIGCLDSGDVNDDGGVDIADAIALLNYLFLGGPAPGAPYPGAGSDPTADSLDCRSGAPCVG